MKLIASKNGREVWMQQNDTTLGFDLFASKQGGDDYIGTAYSLSEAVDIADDWLSK